MDLGAFCDVDKVRSLAMCKMSLRKQKIGKVGTEAEAERVKGIEVLVPSHINILLLVIFA